MALNIGATASATTPNINTPIITYGIVIPPMMLHGIAVLAAAFHPFWGSVP
jgi:hypothetical protein